jgi:FdhD protein
MNWEGDSENPAVGHFASAGVGIYDRSGNRIEQLQRIIPEKPITLYLNDKEVVTLLCVGHHLDELAAGFLYSEGFLRAPEDISGIRIDDEAGMVKVSAKADDPITRRLWRKRKISTCTKGSLFYFSLDSLLSRPVESDFRVHPRLILDRLEELDRLSEAYRHTHGVCSTALADVDGTILFRYDIGHNAADMVLGHVFLNGIQLMDKMLITTGRLTSELPIKAAKVGLPIIVSCATATSLAIDLAASLGVTLIGSARAGRFTVYSGQERINDGLPG